MTRASTRGFVAVLAVIFFVAPATVSYALWSRSATAKVAVSIAAPSATLPAAPTVACSGSGTNPSLTWTTVSGATSYRIYRSQTPLGAAKKTVNAPATSVGLLEADMGSPTTPSQKYDVLVKSVNAAGESVASNIFTIQFKSNGQCAG